MDKLRRTLSLRKKKHKQYGNSSKPHLWLEDEARVREGTCHFLVKYLGSVEVFESRGMQICEEAVRQLRANKTNSCKRALLYVSGDALRLVEDLRKNAKKQQRFSFRKKFRPGIAVLAVLHVTGDSLRIIHEGHSSIDKLLSMDRQGLLVDQTIEKVSFCAPDRNHERAFAYICRDGTTRRWLCHGFIALNDTGERLSHAVGCAFAICLEKKQKREKEAVSISYSEDKTSFTRLGSFKQASLTDRMADPQVAKVAEPLPPSPNINRPVDPNQVERPRASHDMLRQGSFREFPKLTNNGTSSPFKRNYSLRLNDLPSNVQRQREEFTNTASSTAISQPSSGPSTTNQSLNGSEQTGIDQMAAAPATFDPIANMCQQLTEGLTGLSDSKPNSSSQPHNAPVSNLSHPWDTSRAPHSNAWAPPTATAPSTTNPFHPIYNSPAHQPISHTQQSFSPAHPPFNPAQSTFNSSQPVSSLNPNNPFLANSNIYQASSNYTQEFKMSI